MKLSLITLFTLGLCQAVVLGKIKPFVVKRASLGKFGYKKAVIGDYERQEKSEIQDNTMTDSVAKSGSDIMANMKRIHPVVNNVENTQPSIVADGFPESKQNVPGALLESKLNVPGALLESKQNVPDALPESKQNVPDALPESKQNVPDALPESKRNVPDALPESKRNVPDALPESKRNVPDALPESKQDYAKMPGAWVDNDAQSGSSNIDSNSQPIGYKLEDLFPGFVALSKYTSSVAPAKNEISKTPGAFPETPVVAPVETIPRSEVPPPPVTQEIHFQNEYMKAVRNNPDSAKPSWFVKQLARLGGFNQVERSVSKSTFAEVKSRLRTLPSINIPDNAPVEIVRRDYKSKERPDLIAITTNEGKLLYEGRLDKEMRLKSLLVPRQLDDNVRILVKDVLNQGLPGTDIGGVKAYESFKFTKDGLSPSGYVVDAKLLLEGFSPGTVTKMFAEHVLGNKDRIPIEIQLKIRKENDKLLIKPEYIKTGVQNLRYAHADYVEVPALQMGANFAFKKDFLPPGLQDFQIFRDGEKLPRTKPEDHGLKLEEVVKPSNKIRRVVKIEMPDAPVFQRPQFVANVNPEFSTPRVSNTRARKIAAGLALATAGFVAGASASEFMDDDTKESLKK
jgi:hypothetical protein